MKLIKKNNKTEEKEKQNWEWNRSREPSGDFCAPAVVAGRRAERERGRVLQFRTRSFLGVLYQEKCRVCE